jgi:branched-chain amino acid transport system ATP-binding protein
MSSLLEIRDLYVAYGGVHALRGITLHVNEGEIVTMIGANGAGKSTLLNAISAIVKIGSGDLLYNGEPLPRRPHQVVTKGVVQVPEGRQVFANLTVQENLQIGAFLRSDAAEIAKDSSVFTPSSRLEER